ncbi:unnamed protein product [Cercopithifilaria johnstoni]|uniref:Uncharacterized protein n=1 Tax=Cercopithifilaria johnstoni TaxID=2874296 RepID=A0A8J2MA04_9BILA|nr:unnamed protein product [Cercopithifilaria johnstoni]
MYPDVIATAAVTTPTPNIIIFRACSPVISDFVMLIEVTATVATTAADVFTVGAFNQPKFDVDTQFYYTSCKYCITSQNFLQVSRDSIEQVLMMLSFISMILPSSTVLGTDTEGWMPNIYPNPRLNFTQCHTWLECARCNPDRILIDQ